MRDFFPLQLLTATFAGWVNRHQARGIGNVLIDGEAHVSGGEVVMVHERLGGLLKHYCRTAA